ncbi:Gp37Gp68 family protein [Hydrogenobacter thermophilus TK-6]|uniref:Putative bacteriophage protein n=1 Tax=Hydrogenobacter thermophilus (strain DSM 6534 / IAM 12695 / TK-6) TaxID=608538 RepID=D3DG04_HYDTT|nr:DUF5131 family protein [Hydrogenobacter thermophilus]ADO44691.1 Gp37Gp68 family protein [Hydrogenobacter thermophilus TK-6]BAI68756.1 putative bacteriophage protein [Hydrogenobacter thermophilus TK-6]
MKEYRLKEVSKAKHIILEKYFPAWARILKSKHQTLIYVDCFAGSGRYSSGEEGSPLIVARKANELIEKDKSMKFYLIFVEKNKKSAQELEKQLKSYERENVKIFVFNEDSHDFVPELLEKIPKNIPAFFFIDPYGHPLSIPVINKILSMQRKEILLNLMWYAINMHLNNPKAEQTINRMFGNTDWKNQNFIRKERENNFVEYFIRQVNAKYNFKFRIRFSPEDKVHGGENRTKYYLIHFANHERAILLMKEVMWTIGDEEGTFDYSASHQEILFSRTPTVEQLEDVPAHFIKSVFEVMNRAKHLTFQVLTKRSERLLEISKELEWTENIWMGVSVENSNYIYRINYLLQTPAKIKFISFEPLLGPIYEFPTKGIDWVIVGGESGPNARPMLKEWVMEIYRICRENNIPFFFKQWGGVSKRKNGRELNGKIYEEYPYAKKQG